MKFVITNTTKEKVVLTVEAEDADHAAGKYISAMFVAGLIRSIDRDVECFRGENAFKFLNKGWDFTVAAA
jgi:hypothetical protein